MRPKRILLGAIAALTFANPALAGADPRSANAWQQGGRPANASSPEKDSAADSGELNADSQSASETGDPLIGNGIFQAVVFSGRLWLHGAGALISLSLADEARQVHYQSGMLYIAKAGRDLWVLRQPSPKERKVAVSVLRGGTFEDFAHFEFADHDQPRALLSCGDIPCVLSAQAVRVLLADHKEWRRIPLRGKLRGSSSVALLPQSDEVYLGSNWGEWGGGLQRVNIRTGEVVNVERRDGPGLCAGPLNRDCDPVTGLVPDPKHKDCVLASIGLVHMMSHGRILRVCGRRVTSIWERAVPPDQPGDEAPSKEKTPTLDSSAAQAEKPNESARHYLHMETLTEGPGDTEAVYGLEPAANGGFWAITPEALYLFAGDGNQLKKYPLPRLRSVSGVHLSLEIPGVIVLATDINWAVSVSGYTPLVVPLEDPQH